MADCRQADAYARLREEETDEEASGHSTCGARECATSSHRAPPIESPPRTPHQRTSPRISPRTSPRTSPYASPRTASTTLTPASALTPTEACVTIPSADPSTAPVDNLSDAPALLTSATPSTLSPAATNAAAATAIRDVPLLTHGPQPAPKGTFVALSRAHCRHMLPAQQVPPPPASINALSKATRSVPQLQRAASANALLDALLRVSAHNANDVSCSQPVAITPPVAVSARGAPLSAAVGAAPRHECAHGPCGPLAPKSVRWGSAAASIPNGTACKLADGGVAESQSQSAVRNRLWHGGPADAIWGGGQPVSSCRRVRSACTLAGDGCMGRYRC
jgi:hypothetical protein